MCGKVTSQKSRWDGRAGRGRLWKIQSIRHSSLGKIFEELHSNSLSSACHRKNSERQGAGIFS